MKLLTTTATAVALCILGASAVGSQAAPRAFPGVNGRIVFNDQNGALNLVNPDGTGVVRLAGTNASDTTIGASWSPDGKLIAYSKQGGTDADIFVIAPDASGQREITFSRGNDIDPTWSGDGSRIAFETNRNGNSDIYSVAADGTNKTQLTKAPNYSSDPNWSPDGQWIVFDSDRAEKGNFDVYKMHPDGTGLVQLTDSPALDALPAFSPDGRKIVFVSDRAAKDSRKLFLVGADGGTATRLINQSGSTYQMVPDWQPLQAKDPCTI